MTISPALFLVRIEPLEARIAPAFTGTLDLSSLAAGSGTKIAGLNAKDFLGRSVSDAGDVNGDGFDDFVIGSGASTGGSYAGSAYVIFGKSGGLPAQFDLSTLDGTNGFRIDGAANDTLGRRVSGAGDVNGDGFADIIVGATQATGQQTGAAFVILGKADGFTATLKARTLDGTDGFQILGETAGDRFGYSVSAAGDVNGDGFADVIVGAPGFSSNTGASYVFFGQASAFTTPRQAGGLSDIFGIKTVGAATGDNFGYAVSGVGDVNGDGLADFAVGADLANAGAGAAYVVFGTKSSTTPYPLNSTTSIKLSGSPGSKAGYSVGQAGDLNGDGFADFVIGAPGAGAGQAYVIFGKAGTLTDLNLGQLDGHNGFSITGEVAGDCFGDSVKTAGDVNGDGIADLVVGAPFASPHAVTAAGASYVIFGKTGANPFTSSLSLSSLQGPTGFKIQGEAANDYAYSASAAGDINGDGFGDLLVGAQGASPGGHSYAGAAYVVYGGPSGVMVHPAFSTDHKTATYTDVDGDLVKVTVSKGMLEDSNFHLLAKTADSPRAQLLLLDLKTAAGTTSEFSGATVSITAKTPGGKKSQVNVGYLEATNVDLGAVVVAGDLGGLEAGAGAGHPALKSLTVGSLDTFAGRTGDTGVSHLSTIEGSSGPIKIAGDFGPARLHFQTAGQDKGNLASLSIGGSLLGGARDSEGSVKTDGNLGPITIGHDLRGGSGPNSAQIISNGSVGAVKIGGSMEGGHGRVSGFMQVGTTLASLTIGRDLRGGAGEESGDFLALGPVGAVKIGGSIVGDSGTGSAYLEVGSIRGALTIKGDVRGGTGQGSASISSSGALGAVKIGGSVSGGSGEFSGLVQALTDLASLTIGGDLRGGDGGTSGVVSAQISMGAVKIGGAQLGGAGDFSGLLGANADLGKVSIGRSQVGGAGSHSGLLEAGGNIASVTIGGDAIGGKRLSSGGILADGSLGPVNVKGDVRGTAENPYVISGGGPLTGTKSVAIASLKVGGDLERVEILGGFGLDNAPVNGHAQIGAIVIGGNWLASSVSAGVLADMSIAGGGPASVVSSIASITIKGRAFGTLEPGDRFGIAAEQIGAITIFGKKIALKPGAGTDLTPIPLGETPDFSAVEVSKF